ncbi:protein mab-21-like 3 [Saccoglossus kowalevskii]|uniref:Protein mab-21-like 3-like n=1 Tax=Saccoglossus kowalevskii TaxID=10224 RepID=A0ABM0GZM4_SACKO|nr:PREDICTED: protein mab-21-like 3-like [Saccoglossus kowalevskii]
MLATQNGLVGDLNYYTDTQIKMRREKVKAAVNAVHSVVDPILKYVHDKDPRFSHQTWNSGSYASGLKVTEPNEFDFNVPMEGLPNLIWKTADKPAYYTIDVDGQLVETKVPLPNPPNGYHNVTIDTVSDIWKPENNMKMGDYVVPFKVKTIFKVLVKNAVRECKLRESVRVLKKTHGPAITLMVSSGEERISVDLVPLVPANGRGLPPNVLNSWPRSPVWPPKHKVEEVRKIGTDSVAKDNLYWLTSFSRCEIALLDGIDSDEGCRKQCLRLLKKIREDHWQSPALSSYHLKNLLLWECEKYPNSHDWSRDMLGQRFVGLVGSLLKCLRGQNCPHYFIPSINLFRNKENSKLKEPENLLLIADKVQEFYENPCGFIGEWKDGN